MPKVDVLNKEGQVVGEIALSDKVFGAEINPGLLHEAVVAQLANKRQGTAATKTRANVRGGGRKPFRQKGTGRARAGSIRSPQWRGGGIVFGPSPRSFAVGMNKKARRAALRMALSSKVTAGNLVVVDSFNLDAPKTAEVAQLLRNLKVGQRALIVTESGDLNVYKSARNIPGIEASAAVNINVYDVVKAEKLIMIKEAVAKVEEVLA